MLDYFTNRKQYGKICGNLALFDVLVLLENQDKTGKNNRLEMNYIFVGEGSGIYTTVVSVESDVLG